MSRLRTRPMWIRMAILSCIFGAVPALLILAGSGSPARAAICFAVFSVLMFIIAMGTQLRAGATFRSRNDFSDR